MATTPTLPAHVHVAHQLIGMCHHGIAPADRHQAIERAQQLADLFDARLWVLLAQWSRTDPDQRLPYSISKFAAQVVDCLAGIAIDADRDPFDGIDDHHGYASGADGRAEMVRGVGR